MAAAAKLIKSSCLPLGTKLGATISMGAASLAEFSLTQKAMSANKKGKINLEVDKITSNASAGNSDNSSNSPFPTKSSLEGDESTPISISERIDLLNDNLNLHLIMIYLNILLRENRTASGIYKWTNLINAKTYVRFSISLSKRFIKYYDDDALTKNNMLINKAILKYGRVNFSLELLEYCSSKDIIKR